MQDLKFNSILYLEDNKLYRETIGNKLLSKLNYNKLNAVADFDSAKKCISENTYDLALLDIQLINDNRTGFDLINPLRLKNNSVKIIMLSMFYNVGNIKKFYNFKLDGYLTKDLDENTFMDCISSIKENKIFVSPTAQEEWDSYIYDEQKRFNLINEKKLSKREIEIIPLLCDEKENKEIAETLGIEPVTVKTHIHKMLSKINAKTRVGIVSFAYKTGLVSIKNKGSNEIN